MSEEEFLDDFRPMEDGPKDEENGHVAASGAGASESANWEKRAEAELEKGIREPPAARVA